MAGSCSHVYFSSLSPASQHWESVHDIKCVYPSIHPFNESEDIYIHFFSWWIITSVFNFSKSFKLQMSICFLDGRLLSSAVRTKACQFRMPSKYLSGYHGDPEQHMHMYEKYANRYQSKTEYTKGHRVPEAPLLSPFPLIRVETLVTPGHIYSFKPLTSLLVEKCL